MNDECMCYCTRTCVPVYTHTLHVQVRQFKVSVYLLLLHVPGAIFFYVYENQR